MDFRLPSFVLPLFLGSVFWTASPFEGFLSTNKYKFVLERLSSWNIDHLCSSCIVLAQSTDHQYQYLLAFGVYYLPCYLACPMRRAPLFGGVKSLPASRFISSRYRPLSKRLGWRLLSMGSSPTVEGWRLWNQSANLHRCADLTRRPTDSTR